MKGNDFQVIRKWHESSVFALSEFRIASNYDGCMLRLADVVLVAFGGKHMTCHQRVICYSETESCHKDYSRKHVEQG